MNGAYEKFYKNLGDYNITDYQSFFERSRSEDTLKRSFIWRWTIEGFDY